MTLGAITLEEAGNKMPSAPLFAQRISLEGDDAYPDGGTPDFQALAQAAMNIPGANILTVTKAGPCGGYEPVYDQANDKLMMFNYPDALGPAVEVTGTPDLHTTILDLLVIAY